MVLEMGSFSGIDWQISVGTCGVLTRNIESQVEDILHEVMRKAVNQGMANDRGKGVSKRSHSGVDPNLLAGMAEPLLRDHDLIPSVLSEAAGGRVKEES